MKKTKIFEQSFEVSNDFNSDACVKSIQMQLSDLAFKELIKGEKHSLTLDFTISVNQEEESEIDRDYLEAMRFIKAFKETSRDQIKSVEKFDILSLWFDASKIDTSICDKYPLTN